MARVQIVTFSGKAISIDGWCPTHRRLLGHREWESGWCWWCHPEQAPKTHALHALTTEQIEQQLVFRKQADAERGATKA